ncbi:MAG: DUF302 domain-containing protein [Paracoccus sp. (in: a-proteobacteria)]|nr:DUF302 domain-containing protein [Paracoccus sp. (in: a-proteobacteria)]
MTMIRSDADVPATVQRLTDAIEAAGATVLARIDHGEGARAAGMDIGESQLVIFGNPAAGTPAMVRNRAAGLILPLKVLVYEEADGGVWVAYEDVADRLDDLDGLDDDSPEVKPLAAALQKLGRAAAGR